MTRVTRRGAARSVAWTAVEGGGMALISLIALIIYAHLLSPSEFGVAAVALGVVQILSLSVDLVFHDGLVTRREVSQRHYDAALTGSLALGTVLAVGCWTGADLFAWALGDASAGPILQWMSLSLPASGLGAAIAARYRRDLSFRVLALRSLAARFGGAVAGITVALAGGGVWSLVSQHVATAGAASAVLWITAADRPRLCLAFREGAELARIGAGSAAVTTFNSLNQRTFIILVGMLLGTDAAGYLSLAFRTVDMVRDLVSHAVSQVALPIFSRLQDDPRALREAFGSAIELTCLVTFPLFAGMAVTAPLIVELLFGRQWLPAAPYAAVLAVVTFTFYPRIYGAALMTAIGRPFYPLASAMAEFAFILALAALFVSPEAALLVWVARLVVAVPIDLVMTRVATGLPLSCMLRGVPALLAISMAMAGAVAVVDAFVVGDGIRPPLRVCLLAASGVFVYAGLIAIAKRPLLARAVGFARDALALRRLGPAIPQ